MRHIISILLQNEAGALSRVAALFSTRGYNIESLSVAPTEDPQISRMTLVTTGSDAAIDQITKQVLKLVDVVNMADMTMDDHIEREMLLMKVKVNAGADAKLREVVEKAGASVLDDSLETFTVELTGTNDRVDAFIASMGKCSDITAVVRSGAMAIARGHNVLGANF